MDFGEAPDVPVKVVRISSCTVLFTKVLHPPHRPNRGNKIQLVNCDARKHREIKHQNGRERPHFFGFQPPKKFLGSLPPVLARSRMREQLCRTSSEPVIAYDVHPGVHLRVHTAARCITVKPKRFARYSGWFTHSAKAPSWAGATPLRCLRNRGGRSSPTQFLMMTLISDS
jgi:hypothetical protein